MKKPGLFWLALVLLHAGAGAADLTHAQGLGKQVTLVTKSGKVLMVREKYPVREVLLAQDGMAAAWLLDDVSAAETAGESASSSLVVYRNGKRRVLACGQLIREYWFWENGRKIAFDCSGNHFAGNEVLFDTLTLKEVDRFHQADVPPERRPPWSASGGQ